MMTVRNHRGFILVLALAGLVSGWVWCGCGASGSPSPGADTQIIVFVRAPRGTLPPNGSPSTFRDPYPLGSRLVTWSPERPNDSPRDLVKDFAAAGAPMVSFDGTHVLFVGKKTPQETWRVYEVSLQGGKPIPISPEGCNATSATYIGKWGPADDYAEAAGDFVAFSCDREQSRDPHDGGAAFSLWTSRKDGSKLMRITHNIGSDVHPTVLQDGRILYSAWQSAGIGRPEGGWSLFTVMNDGTMLFPFYGSHHAPAAKGRPQLVGDSRIAFVAGKAGAESDLLQTVTLARPMHSTVSMAPDAGHTWRSASYWDEESLIVSARKGGDGSYGLHLLSLRDSGMQEVLDDPEFDEVDACRVRVRKPPKGHVSNVQPEKGSELLCLNARVTDKQEFARGDPTSAQKLKIYRGIPSPLGGGAQGPYEVPDELLMTLDLAPDGSAIAEIPGDMPLRFETVDGDGNVILDSRGWVWVRSGNGRSCIGCHEDRESCAPNRVPDVLQMGSPYQEEQRKKRQAVE